MAMRFATHSYMISNRVPGKENTPAVGAVRYLIRQNEPQSTFSADAAGFREVAQNTWLLALVQDVVARAAGDTPRVAGYIHGFDTSYDFAFSDMNSFSSGLIAAGLPGVLIGVTWPSYNDDLDPLSSYDAAQKAAKASAPVLEALLLMLKAVQANVRNTTASLICHSMGNFLLAEGVGQITNPLDTPLERVVMLAADVVNTIFTSGDQGNKIAALTHQVEVYFSENDDVLRASGVINLDTRLGFSGPTQPTIANVTSLSGTQQVATSAVAQVYVPGGLSNIIGDVVVHSCYRYVPALLQDQVQTMTGLPTPHRKGTSSPLELIRFPAA